MTNIKTALAVIAVVMGVPGVASALEYNTGKFYLQKECVLDASITARH